MLLFHCVRSRHVLHPPTPMILARHWSWTSLRKVQITLFARKSREGDVDRVRAQPGVVGVFSDPNIEPCIICPGSLPLGDHKDVEALLCTSRMHKCGMDGSGVLVAIVDTGVNLAYLNSKGKTPSFNAAWSWTLQPGIPGSMPVDHGTMCAFDVLHRGSEVHHFGYRIAAAYVRRWPLCFPTRSRLMPTCWTSCYCPDASVSFAAWW